MRLTAVADTAERWPGTKGLLDGLLAAHGYKVQTLFGLRRRTHFTSRLRVAAALWAVAGHVEGLADQFRLDLAPQKSGGRMRSDATDSIL